MGLRLGDDQGLVIVNDTFAALRAGATRPWGIVLICGQGINGAAVGIDDRRVPFAWAAGIAGDWGGVHRRAHLVRREPEVVLAGSVFRTGDDAFHERLRTRITAAVPGARIGRLSAPPVVGAALIGLDRLAGGTTDPMTEARVRAALDAWNATPVVVTSS